MPQSTENKILTKICKARRGTLFFSDDFSSLGDKDAIRQALKRLVSKEELIRVARGIYTRPKSDPLIGILRPTLDEIARAVARRDKARIVPTGTYALHALGLSTQVPLNVVYLTDGSPRKIKVGKRGILFKKTSPKNLSAIGEISGLAIQALKMIGKDNVSGQELRKIIQVLRDEKSSHLKNDLQLAPEWIRKIMKKALVKSNDIGLGLHDWESIPDNSKINIYREVARRLELPTHAVEKDWWVIQTLRLVFQMDVAPYLVFKGGTSLSKAWNIIERFSEDIDLALDRSYLGFDREMTKSQVRKLRKVSAQFISEKFFPELKTQFEESGFDNVEVKLREPLYSDQDPMTIEIGYTPLTEHSEYIPARILVELGSRSLREPFTRRTFTSLVAENYPHQAFHDSKIEVASVDPARTFWEKIFLLHEEFQKPVDKIRTNRMSRHLYDIERIMTTQHALSALSNNKLFHEIVKHRRTITPIRGIDYNNHKTSSLNPIPPDVVLKEWGQDYEIMREQLIYGESLTFSELLNRIRELKSKINELGWGLNT